MADEKKKTKCPTALKRDIRNDKRRLINKNFKSRARTVLRRFEEALQAGDPSEIESRLSQVYSFMDKGVKRNIYKKNKASRTKARMTARAQAKLATA